MFRISLFVVFLLLSIRDIDINFRSHFIFVYSKINKFRNHFLLYRCFFIENIFYLICNIFNFLSKLHSNIPSPLIFSSNMISIFQKRFSFRAIFLPKEKKKSMRRVVPFFLFFHVSKRTSRERIHSLPSPIV